MLKGFVIGFFCFTLFIILHVVIFHMRKIKHRFTTIEKIFYSILPVYVFLYILIPTETMIIMPADPGVSPGMVIGLSKIFNFIMGILIYLLLYFGYCQFYFIIDRSISVRIMIELEKTKDKKLTFEEIKKVYSPDYIVSRRLKQMIENKYIIEDAGFYKNIRKGKITAKILQFLKEYLQLGEGG